jgi:hypothetical protein
MKNKIYVSGNYNLIIELWEFLTVNSILNSGILNDSKIIIYETIKNKEKILEAKLKFTNLNFNVNDESGNTPIVPEETLVDMIKNYKKNPVYTSEKKYSDLMKEKENNL